MDMPAQKPLKALLMQTSGAVWEATHHPKCGELALQVIGLQSLLLPSGYCVPCCFA